MSEIHKLAVEDLVFDVSIVIRPKGSEFDISGMYDVILQACNEQHSIAMYYVFPYAEVDAYRLSICHVKSALVNNLASLKISDNRSYLEFITTYEMPNSGIATLTLELHGHGECDMQKALLYKEHAELLDSHNKLLTKYSYLLVNAVLDNKEHMGSVLGNEKLLKQEISRLIEQLKARRA
jgi:hypothetical protein